MSLGSGMTKCLRQGILGAERARLARIVVDILDYLNI